jgi:hypothetical protein
MRASLFTATLFALAAGCSDKDSNDPNDPVDPTDPNDPPTPEESARDSDEVASILTAHLRAEFPAQLMFAKMSRGNPVDGISVTSGTNAAGQLEYTGTGVINGLNVSIVFHCNDGITESVYIACDANAHHSHVKVTSDGAQTADALTMDAIERVVDWEIRDLLVSKARFRGPDSLALHTSMSTDGEQADYNLQYSAIYEKVRYLAADVFPTFGTIDFQLSVDRQRGDDHRVFNAVAQLIYGASGVPTTLAIDGVFYNLDLSLGTAIRQ